MPYKYTVLEPEGQYSGISVEEEIVLANDIELIRGNLHNVSTGAIAPFANLSPETCRRADGLLLLKASLRAEDLDVFPNLKAVVRLGVGYDKLDRQALAGRNIIVCNIPDYGTEEIAAHALGLALALRRGIALYHDQLRTKPQPGEWQAVSTPLVSRIRDQVFGILGMGRIGTAVALRAKAFGWRVIFYDPFQPNGYDKAIGVERVNSVEDLFKRSSVLSVHCPLTTQTRNLVSLRLINLLPPSACLINTARGEVVDLDALEVALRSSQLAGAALDVLPDEPITSTGPVHPLIEAYRNSEDWLQGRLIITPHVAWLSSEGLQEIRLKGIQTMRDVLLTGFSRNIIKPEAE